MAISRLDSSSSKVSAPAPQAPRAAAPAPQASHSIGDFFKDVFVDAFKVVNAASQKLDELVNKPAPQTLAAMPSFTNTVQPSGTLTDAEKTARGALKIDRSADPKTYDGMYLGADGYAYPPGKFDSSEVPPFKPDAQHALNPPRSAYYTNGIGSGVGGVIGEARDTARKSGNNIVPIYNATQGQFDDVVQTAEDRAGLGDDKAADTLRDVVVKDLKAGKQVNVIGYSQGGAIVSHAMEMAAKQVDTKTLANANVVTVAGAGKNFPAGPKYTFYVNRQDSVPNWLGIHEKNPIPDVLNALAGMSPLSILNGGGVGTLPPGAELRTLDDAAKGDNGAPVNLSAHDLGTYYNHIADAA